MTRFLRGYESTMKALRHQIVDIQWYSRGALSREEAWTLSPDERQDWMELGKDRMNLVKETKLPLI